MRKINAIILHCAATEEGKDIHAADIRRWHMTANGWKDIGYHWVVDLDGRVEKGRDEAVVGAHCKGHNSNSIGVCYVGGLAADRKTPKDTRTPQQKAALKRLVKDLMKAYGLTLQQVHCHNEYAAKACPSFKIETFRKEMTE